MSYTKLDQGFLKSPLEETCGNPNNTKGGPGEYDGLDGYPKRTGGLLPEKVIDKELGE